MANVYLNNNLGALPSPYRSPLIQSRYARIITSVVTMKPAPVVSLINTAAERGSSAIALVEVKRTEQQRRIGVIKSLLGFDRNRIGVFDKLKALLTARYHVTPILETNRGAELIRKKDVYGAAKYILEKNNQKFDAPAYIDEVVGGGVYQPGLAQRLAYQLIPPSRLTAVAAEVQTQNMKTFPPITTPAVLVNTPPEGAVVIPASPDMVKSEIPLFTDVAAKMGGVGGLALLALGAYIFISSGKRAFKSSRPKRRRG